ncbi:hypothetical protein PX699_00515 [Sphingobium sp. H39-3-25]|uniref:hypothetical protein n=1 Tax=Sphingobium arseniciresistens TaxID=3030834 RepID=UPI0023B8BDE0|nr:hypothetical protein [Sphingobium arseniciresistens]
MDIPTRDEIIEAIDAFLLRHSMAPSRFGRLVTGEPQLLDSIRKGRSPSLNVLEKIRDFIRETDAAHAQADTAAQQASSSGNVSDNSPMGEAA